MDLYSVNEKTVVITKLPKNWFIAKYSFKRLRNSLQIWKYIPNSLYPSLEEKTFIFWNFVRKQKINFSTDEIE